MNKPTDAVSKVQQLLLKIPRGKVVTYAELARAMGKPRSVRAVGTWCGKNPEPDRFPCFKVVRSDGGLGGFALGLPEKIRRLAEEGVMVEKGKVVDLQKREFRFSPTDS